MKQIKNSWNAWHASAEALGHEDQTVRQFSSNLATAGKSIEKGSVKSRDSNRE